MAGQLLRAFAARVADWSLDDEWLSTALAFLPRKESTRQLPLFWERSPNGECCLCLGRDWSDLSPLEQMAHARLQVHHLLLGHLEEQTLSKNRKLAFFWQAFHYLPESLQALWPDWQQYTALRGKLPEHPEIDWLEAQLIDKPVADQLERVIAQQAFWRLPFGKSRQDSSVESLKTQVERNVLIGEVPPSWSVWVSLSQKNAKLGLHWSNILRRHLRRYHRRKLDFTQKRISKRYGTAPGIRFRKEAQIGVVLDTSASMSIEALTLFYQELRLIHRLGHQLLLLEADTAVRRVQVFDPGRQKVAFPGRGNTAYDPALHYLNQQRVDLIIYATDGLGPEPGRINTDLLWMVQPPAGQETWIQEKMRNWAGKKIFISTTKSPNHQTTKRL